MRQLIHRAMFGAGWWRRAASHLPRWGLCVLLLLPSVVNARGAASPENKPTQFEVEAAYLFDFGKFVTWPPAQPADSPFLICVLGQDPFGRVLERTIAGETLGGRPVQEKRITHTQDAIGCSVLYISSSESGRLSKILPAIQEAPVLTVSDIPDFVQQGGMIQFVLHNGRVRFEVNLAPTHKNGLAMSSELLKVAVQVVRGGGGH